MLSLISILVFVILLSVPGFYIITRKMFPQQSKKSAGWVSAVLTVILVGILLAVMGVTL